MLQVSVREMEFAYHAGKVIDAISENNGEFKPIYPFFLEGSSGAPAEPQPTFIDRCKQQLSKQLDAFTTPSSASSNGVADTIHGGDAENGSKAQEVYPTAYRIRICEHQFFSLKFKEPVQQDRTERRRRICWFGCGRSCTRTTNRLPHAVANVATPTHESSDTINDNTRAHRAHYAVNAAINKLLTRCQQLDKVFQMQGIWGRLRDNKNGYRGHRRMNRDQFLTAVKNIYNMNDKRNKDFDSQPGIKFSKLAARIVTIITPLQVLQRRLDNMNPPPDQPSTQSRVNVNPTTRSDPVAPSNHLEDADDCLTERWLMNPESNDLQKVQNPSTMKYQTFDMTDTLPAAVVKIICEFVDFGKLRLEQTKQVVQEALRVVDEESPWHPYYGCSKAIVLTHRYEHTQDDGSFNFVSCREVYLQYYVKTPCEWLLKQICCFIVVLEKNCPKQIFGYSARCEFLPKLGLKIWML